MRKNKWDSFLVSATGIAKIMSNPQGLKNPTQNQRKIYSDFYGKEDLTPKQYSDLEKVILKMERLKDPELSKTAEKYAITRYSWEKYNRGTLPIHPQKAAVEKGKMMEALAISTVEDFSGVKYTQLPNKFVKNSHLFGRCEAISECGSVLLDVKTTWGIHGYLPHHVTKLSASNWFQMQGYLDLYGLETGLVCVVLLNTPDALIAKEIARHTERYELGEIDDEKYSDEMERLSLCYDYSKIPKKRKVITFEVNKEPDVIARIYRKVERIRIFLKEFDKKHVRNRKILTLSEDYGPEDSIELDTDSTS